MALECEDVFGVETVFVTVPKTRLSFTQAEQGVSQYIKEHNIDVKVIIDKLCETEHTKGLWWIMISGTGEAVAKVPFWFDVKLDGRLEATWP